MTEILFQILLVGYYALRVYFYVIIIQILLSWTPLTNSSFYHFLDKITAPFLHLFRGKIVFNHLDFTPMIGLVLFQFILIYMESVLF